MRRIKVLVVAIAVVVALATALTLLLSHDSSNNETPAQAPSFSGIATEYRGTEPCEVIVDLGNVRYSSTVEETIRLTNLGDSPIVLLDYTTQCRCMWLDFERDVIAVNDSIDITLTFDSRGEWGTVGNYMEITTSVDNAPIVLWIGAEIE